MEMFVFHIFHSGIKPQGCVVSVSVGVFSSFYQSVFARLGMGLGFRIR